MKMAKPSTQDKEAAEDLLQLMQLIDGFGGPARIHYEEDSLRDLLGSEDFDCENTSHLKTFYNNMVMLMHRAPGFQNRVISGMCHVIMYEKNEFIDPDSDCIELHPRFTQLSLDSKRYRWLRARDLDTIAAGGVFAGMTPDNVVLNGEDLDAAIDAAMETQASTSSSH